MAMARPLRGHTQKGQMPFRRPRTRRRGAGEVARADVAPAPNAREAKHSRWLKEGGKNANDELVTANDPPLPPLEELPVDVVWLPLEPIGNASWRAAIDPDRAAAQLAAASTTSNRWTPTPSPR